MRAAAVLRACAAGTPFRLRASALARTLHAGDPKGPLVERAHTEIQLPAGACVMGYVCYGYIFKYNELL